VRRSEEGTLRLGAPRVPERRMVLKVQQILALIPFRIERQAVRISLHYSYVLMC